MGFFAEKDFFEDVELLEKVTKTMSGELSLDWLDAATERVKCAPQDTRRGFTMDDINVGSYGYSSLPELIRNNYSMAARGSERVGQLPDLGYVVNRKSDVWADAAAALYEEAKSRRWVPAVDVAWGTLHESPLPPALEAATAQLATFLEEMSLGRMEFPSRWVAIINQEFIELKSLLCAQMIDEARHVEVFRKRALAGGQGLKRASATAEQALKEMVFGDSYAEGSVACNVLLGSLLLGVLGHAGAVTVSAVDQKIFRLVGQDVGRALAYGSAALAYHVAHRPGACDAMHDFLDHTEHTWLGVAASRELIEPLAILTAGGTDRAAVQNAMQKIGFTLERSLASYLAHLEKAGVKDRSRRSRLPQVLAAARG